MADVGGRSALARKIIAERERRRWTQADLASRARVSRSWVAAVETGTQPTPRLGFLRRVAEVLDLDLSSLMAADLDDVLGREGGDAAAIHRKLDRLLDNQDAMLGGIEETLEGVRAITRALADGRLTPELRRALDRAVNGERPEEEEGQTH